MFYVILTKQSISVTKLQIFCTLPYLAEVFRIDILHMLPYLAEVFRIDIWYMLLYVAEVFRQTGMNKQCRPRSDAVERGV